MDKNAIKKYAIWARRELIARVSQKALQYGILEGQDADLNADSVNGKVLSDDEKKQRKALISKIKEKGYQQVMEEVAYTWFNRFCALRFMEVNNYLPSHIRVFTNEQNEFKPQIIDEAIHLELDGLNIEKVYAYKEANDNDNLYKYLIITQCNALNKILPGMFQNISDYTELLFPDNILRDGSVIHQMIELIPEEDWQDAVQIIGWLYQYYNTELLEQINENNFVCKHELPAKTQFFTTDWIVRYMVENSLGRLWLEGHDNDSLKAKWKYYIDEADQEDNVKNKLKDLRAEYKNIKPEEIKVIDPCMGSGHILVYAFDVLMQIYESYGYTQRDATHSILKNNIYGLDIDERAYQLAYFAVMMKARQYNRRILTENITLNLFSIQESNEIREDLIDFIADGNNDIQTDLTTICDELKDAKEYGSILNISQIDFERLYDRINEISENFYGDIFNQEYQRDINEIVLPLIRQAETMAQKYDVVVTNPPYLGVKKFNSNLTRFINANYKPYKYDLFACFIVKAQQMINSKGFVSMLTQQSWLNVDSFEKLRINIIEKDTMLSILHLGNNALEGGLGTVAFVCNPLIDSNYVTRFVDLSCDDYIEKSENLHNHQRHYSKRISVFKFLPKTVFAYDVSSTVIEIFEKGTPIKNLTVPRSGLVTRNNNLFLRLWHEVSNDNIDYNCDLESYIKRWYPHTKGGGYRKWYGNFEYVVNWKNNGFDIREATKNANGGSIVSQECYFHEGLSWSLSTFSSKFSLRYLPKGFIFNVEAPAVFDVSNSEYLLGFLNTVVAGTFLDILSDNLHYKTNDIGNTPLIDNLAYHSRIIECVKDNISISREDWDSFESSWDFKKHPLLNFGVSIYSGLCDTVNEETVSKLSLEVEKSTDTFKVYEKDVPLNYRIETAYEMWQEHSENRFNQLKDNEEELNRIFIEIYGLQDELTPEVADKDITVRKADLQREIKSLISYAIGCMFGRYSLDVEGLAYAGGDWNEKYITTTVNNLKGTFTLPMAFSERRITHIRVDGEDVPLSYAPDMDNILPICDDEYFEDDIVGKFVNFIKVVYGEETLEENLKFIADALGGKGTPKEVIRNYFLNDFYADHCKIYQKRPIYWLFDSGKKNGFKALIYMHRYHEDTLARMRTDYVHEQQARYRTAIEDLEQRVNAAETSERVKLNKTLVKIKEQSEEIRLYEEKIHHLADQMIRIDLDDGVKHNYELFKDVLAKIK